MSRPYIKVEEEKDRNRVMEAVEKEAAVFIGEIVAKVQMSDDPTKRMSPLSAIILAVEFFAALLRELDPNHTKAFFKVIGELVGENDPLKSTILEMQKVEITQDLFRADEIKRQGRKTHDRTQ